MYHREPKIDLEYVVVQKHSVWLSQHETSSLSNTNPINPQCQDKPTQNPQAKQQPKAADARKSISSHQNFLKSNKWDIKQPPQPTTRSPQKAPNNRDNQTKPKKQQQ